MGNCALKPKVLSEVGAPAPEELKVSVLEYQKIDAAKSLSSLFLQEKAEKKTKEDEKTTPEKMPVTEDRKTALAEVESPTKEATSPVTETKSPVMETKAPTNDQKVGNEEATVRGEKVNDDATVKETETEAKPEEVRREA
ncbi:hypothetical protein EUTSA_v10027542mg [Eutrema salsugineum]|uniref:Uncharacterized protein n=1 Tax=Eutrema salsugineum TaxID=72664 RepID=V4MDB8_EUTSA|nr:uncharacterized protein LOC18029078 [Eutrema salsugineum]ESQ53187.1 hypothetical protein EUTSA_v10027542mg [Eutrema salsugineum]